MNDINTDDFPHHLISVYTAKNIQSIKESHISHIGKLTYISNNFIKIFPEHKQLLQFAIDVFVSL